MLLLIAGATGNIGTKLIDSLHSRGHQIRALCRNPSKLTPTHHAKLHSTITSTSYYDIPALDLACSGVDAVICAYKGLPELQLEGQLLLLRAAERAGVTRFVSASWNADWRTMTLGMQETYDALICFRHQVKLTGSSVKPIYLFTGVLAEVFFSTPGHGNFSPANNGIWDPVGKTLECWGTGDEVWHLTTERNAAEFAAEIVLREDASGGGDWTVFSDKASLKEIAAVYERARGRKVEMHMRGNVEELRAKALEARSQGSPREYWRYIGWFYQLYTIDGTWTLGEPDNHKLGVKTTSLEDFLRDNPSI